MGGTNKPHGHAVKKPSPRRGNASGNGAKRLRLRIRTEGKPDPIRSDPTDRRIDRSITRRASEGQMTLVRPGGPGERRIRQGGGEGAAAPAPPPRLGEEEGSARAPATPGAAGRRCWRGGGLQIRSRGLRRRGWGPWGGWQPIWPPPRRAPPLTGRRRARRRSSAQGCCARRGRTPQRTARQQPLPILDHQRLRRRRPRARGSAACRLLGRTR